MTCILWRTYGKAEGNVMLFFPHFAAALLSEKHPTYRLQIREATSVFSPEPHVAG